MILEQVMNNPKNSLLYMERYVNNGSPSGFTWINQTSNETSPLCEKEYFLLDILCVEDTIELVGDIPAFFNAFGENSILIHPDMYEVYNKKGFKIQKSCIRVSPISSSRTVKLLDFPGYVKLNYNGIIGRIDRSLTDKHAYSSIEMTEYLRNALKKSVYNKLAFFPEPGAVVYRNEKKDLNIGMVYRKEVPHGKNINKIKFIIPMFSSFAHDRNASDEYLLIQLIKKSQKDPEEYVLNDLIFLIIDNYFNLLLNEGIQPEWHAQNLLLGIDENCTIVSLIMRDLESIDIDQTLQESVGIQKLFKSYPYKYLNNSQYNYQIKHSFMYDFKIGEYIFKPIIECISEYYNLNEKSLERKIKEYSKQYIEQLPKDFFPSDGIWYSFDNVLIDRSISERPYIRNLNVKYRG